MTPTYLGFDIGATKIFCGVFDANFQMMQSETLPTPEHCTNEKLLHVLTELIHTHLQSTIQKIGIGIAGFVHQGVLLASPNLPEIHNLPLQAELQKQTSLPVHVLNDARSFTLAESLVGAGKGASSVVGVTFGTGVGGGFVQDGKLYEGHSGIAGEIGHLLIGATTIEEQLGGKFAPTFCNTLFQTSYTSPEEIEDEIRIESELGLKIQETYIEILHTFFLHIILTYNPEKIIIGGSIGKKLLPLLLPEIEKQMKRIPYPHHTSFVISTLENAGSIGGLLL